MNENGIFKLFPGASKKVCFVFFHGDEPAAKEVALQAAKSLGGGAVIFQGCGRCVTFDSVQIDPNRLWTSGPIPLADGSEISNAENPRMYALLRQNFFWPIREFFEEHGTLIALHNNRQIDYSVHGPFSSQVRKILPADNGRDQGDFVLLTRKDDFLRLSSLDSLSLILQRSDCPEDGSLSVWTARRRIRYFNIETKIRLNSEETVLAQQKMLESVISIL